jgi:hypothetical protein
MARQKAIRRKPSTPSSRGAEISGGKSRRPMPESFTSPAIQSKLDKEAKSPSKQRLSYNLANIPIAYQKKSETNSQLNSSSPHIQTCGCPACTGNRLNLQRSPILHNTPTTTSKSLPASLISQRSKPRIQGGFWSKIKKGFKKVGKAIGGAAKKVGKAIGKGVKTVGGWIKKGAKAIGKGISKVWDTAVDIAKKIGKGVSAVANWIGERIRDGAMWLVNLVRDLPARLARLVVTLWDGLVGIISFIPEAIMALAKGGIKGLGDWLWQKAKSGGAWVVQLLTRVLDIFGAPEALEFLLHIVTKARPLRGDEIAAASAVLGPSAIRYGDVRVSEGGLLNLIFKLNNSRAFTTFHTINLPAGTSLAVVVHELTHVYQFEKAGTVYITQALGAQIQHGTSAYNYGGPAGLLTDYLAGKHYAQYNREQQGQIAEDYYDYVITGGGSGLTTDQRNAYEFFINELRAGKL